MTDRHRFLNAVTPLALVNAVHGLMHGSTTRRPVSVNPELSALTVRERPAAGSRRSAGPASPKSVHPGVAHATPRHVLSIRAFTADPHYQIPSGAGLSVTVRASNGTVDSLTLRPHGAAADGTPRRGFRGDLEFQRSVPIAGHDILHISKGTLITVEYRQPDGSILIASASL